MSHTADATICPFCRKPISSDPGAIHECSAFHNSPADLRVVPLEELRRPNMTAPSYREHLKIADGIVLYVWSKISRHPAYSPHMGDAALQQLIEHVMDGP